MELILLIILLVLSVVMSTAILLQQRSGGVGGAFGGAGSSIQTAKRGGDKFLHIATIVLAVLFLGTSAVLMILA